MKNVFVVLVALTLFMACEAPVSDHSDEVIYRGMTVEKGSAPFLRQNALAKDDGTEPVVIAASSSETTVYGLVSEPDIYLAEGGEALPIGTWVGSLDGQPIEVSVEKGVILTFETMTTVTILAADNIIYIDGRGDAVAFSGTGVIETSEIFTQDNGYVTLVTTVQFAIGGEGTDPQ